MKHLFFATLLIILSVLFRTVWHLGANIEFVTTATLLASWYLGSRWAFAVSFTSIVVSDFFLGNSTIYLFTWSAFLLIAGIGTGAKYALRFERLGFVGKLVGGVGTGMVSGVFFYLFTNFGVWYLDGWNMYTNDLAGIMKAYLMGLPFLRYTLMGTIGFMTVSIIGIESARALAERFALSKFLVAYRKTNT